MPDEDQRYSHQRTRHGNNLCGGHHGASRRARRQALYLGRARKVRDAGTPEVVARFKPKLKAAERAVGGENAPHDEQGHSRPVDQTIHRTPGRRHWRRGPRHPVV